MAFVSPKALLRRLGLRAKKPLGQHFLLHPHQARRIVAALDLTGQETVVEIGAGLGGLTVFLAGQAAQVVALERDPELARFLAEELFREAPRVRVVGTDALKYDFAHLSHACGQPLVVVGNLPYQITSPLLFRLIDQIKTVAAAVLMMQAEVGQRLMAAPGGKDYGILSVLVQYYFSVQRLFSLSPENFYPAPQVDSVVLRFLPDKTTPAAVDEVLLTRVVKAAFATRRKTLNNTLVSKAAAFGLTSEAVRGLLTDLHIDPQRRGETLSVAEFVTLANGLADLRGNGARRQDASDGGGSPRWE